MRTYPIPVFSVDNANYFSDEKKRVSGVGVSQRLVDAEGPALLDCLPVLVDFLLRELRDELDAGFDLFDGLRLEHARGDCL